MVNVRWHTPFKLEEECTVRVCMSLKSHIKVNCMLHYFMKGADS